MDSAGRMQPIVIEPEPAGAKAEGAQGGYMHRTPRENRLEELLSSLCDEVQSYLCGMPEVHNGRVGAMYQNHAHNVLSAKFNDASLFLINEVKPPRPH